MTREDHEMHVWQQAYDQCHVDSAEHKAVHAAKAVEEFRKVFPVSGPPAIEVIFDAWRALSPNDRSTFLTSIGAAMHRSGVDMYGSVR